MSLPPLEGLVGPLSEDAPSGPDLGYDPVFQALELAAQPRPDQEMGDAKIEGSGPEWREVRKLALELFERTRDLRVGVYLAQAALHTDGWEGFGQGIGVLHGLVDGLWETVHPELDPDDNLDPTMRLNTLAGLNDSSTTLKWIKEAPVVELRGVGRFGLRDVEIARGQAQPKDGENVPPAAAVEGAFSDAPLEELESAAAGAKQALSMWQALDQSITGRLGASQAPDLSPMAKVLQTVVTLLDEKLAARGGGDGSATESTPAEGVAAPVAGAPASAASVAANAGPPGVHSREDVIKALDLILDYYRRAEPASPVPLLCDRAKRLVRKDFMAILKDLLPDAVDEAEKFRGAEDGDDDSD